MISRRELLGQAGALSAAWLPASAHKRVARPIDECAHGDVVLLEGAPRAQAAATLETLLALDEDKLLRPFRAAAGMAVGLQGFGGWYDASPDFDPPKNMTGFIPGHSFGQYVSALARGFAVTGDVRAQARIGRLLAGFAPTITPDFYKGYPLPAYTYDKHVVGLIDAHRHAGNREAMGLLHRATDAVLPWLPGHAVDRRVAERTTKPNMAFGWDETYTLPENLYLAAELGGGERYLAMARAYLLDRPYFDLLAAGKNDLPHRHAYSHVNALASAMQAWLIDRNPKHLAAARNGMQFVLDQSYATGGWGPDEGFVEPGTGTLGDKLAKGHASFEAPCGTYGHFKLARYLLRATGDSRYGDSMERLFYNAALGLLPLKPDGTAFYYANYSDGAAKEYYPQRCPCCSGTIGQLVADYGISAYFQSSTALYVNLYTPSRVSWPGKDGPLTITQTGDYPLGDKVTMTVTTRDPVWMSLCLRIPAWAGPATRLKVNGAPMPVVPGRFAPITRKWQNGDRIELVFDQPLRAEPIDAQTPGRVAMVHGPLALFAVGDDIPAFTAAQLMTLRRRRGEYRLASGQRFLPWPAIQGERTRLYQHLV